MSPLDDLNARIERVERIAYEVPRLSERQLDGFACIACGNEVEPQRPIGHRPRGQLFECVGHERGAEDENERR